MDETGAVPQPSADAIDQLGGPTRFARLVQAAAMDVMVWEIDFEIWFGRKPTEEELAKRRHAAHAARMKPGLLWPGVDF